MPLRIAIVGAGIGGLAAAIALSAEADEITLIERRTGFGEAGAGIQLSPNASRILSDLGLGGALARVASEPERIVMRALRSGRAIGTVALGSAARARFGAPYWSLARADLHTALLDAARSCPNVRLRVGRSLAAIAERDGKAVVTFSSAGGGAETIEADLVIGADGLRSATRAALGDTRTPLAAGFTAFRAVVPAAALPHALASGEGGLWLGPGRHVVHYPVAAGRDLNIVAIVRGGGDLEGWGSPETPARVTDAFAGAAEPLRTLLAAPAEWTAWSLHDLPATVLARGRTALLGDAGHPALPFLAQGGGMAIEDAAVLAQEVARRPDDLPEALRRYAARRLPRVRRVQSGARRNAYAYHCAGLPAVARNLVIRRHGPDGMLERLAWLYGWRVDG